MTTSASSPTMIGRDSELARLREVLAEAARGATRAVVIGGEAGIGKTRLLREFEADVAGSVLLLRGQCVDLGAVAAPYAPIKSVLRALVEAVGGETMVAAAGPGKGALIALLPELAAVEGSASAPAGQGSIPGGGDPIAASSDQLHEAVAVLLENFSRDTPVLVVIEDLQWVDGASLNMLRFLFRALSSGRILLVLSYRSDDVSRGHPLRGFLSELERSRSIERRELKRLNRAQVRKQAKAILGAIPPAEVIESVFLRSEGVPFFVEELLGLEGCSTREELPDTLRELLLARYERLSEPTQHLLRLVSAGGVSVAHELLAGVYAGTSDELDTAAREAVLANVLLADDDSYSFRHALVREAIHADLVPGERARFHARYAEALEADSGTRRVAAEVSHHWIAAHHVAKAFPASLLAMSEARAAYAYSTAAQMGERALELWEQVPEAERIAGMDKIDLIGRTASHLRNAGEGERSLAMVNLALEECPREDGLRYARLLRDKAFYLANAGKPGSIPMLEQALDLVPPGTPGEMRATLLASLAGRFMIEARLGEAIEMAEAALIEAVAVGSARYSSISANIAGVSRVSNGQIEDGLAELERARVLADGDSSATLRHRVNASDVMYLLGRYEEAVELAEDGLAKARELGVERSSGVILASNAVDPLFALGQWERAETLIDRGLALDPPLAFKVYLQRDRLWAMLWRGDPDEAAQQFRSLRGSMAGIIEVEMQTRLGVARVAGEIALAQGDLD
ncbi:ATP-binding protein [Luethyella okanaganae]|uniref:ATP-binding protein n=1 Tax=Luethyella okanaganae TaxID=69372 RepID=A0ABW1VKK5_9MICO